MTAENAEKVQWDCEHSGNLQFLQSKNLQCITENKGIIVLRGGVDQVPPGADESPTC